MSDELRRLRDETRANGDAVERARRATSRELAPADLKAILRTVPPAPGGAAARIKANTAGIRPGRRRGWTRVVIGALIAVLVPFVALHDPDVSSEIAPGSLVAGLAADGHGSLSGTRAHPRLAWQDGTVRIDTDATDLVITTREAEIRASHPLTVTRDMTGTTVAGERGSAITRCLADGVTHDGGVTCPPVSAEGMLNLARSQRESHLANEMILATIDAGLARPAGSDAARAELDVLRIQTLADAGRTPEALSAARARLAGTDPLRRDELQRLAAALALTTEGCSGALPHLEALAPTSLDAALRLAACAPDRARPVLDAAATLAVTPEDRQALAITRSRLGVP